MEKTNTSCCRLAFGSMLLSSVFMYSAANYAAFSAAYFIMFVGNGLLEVALALLGARVFTRNTGTMMNVSHFFYGLSSMLGPLTDRFGYTLSILVLSGFSGVCSIMAIVAGEQGAVLFALSGIGIAPVYPTVMVFLARRYAGNSGTAITFTVTMMGIITVINSFIIGAVTDEVKAYSNSFMEEQAALISGLKAGYLFIGACAIVCSLASIVLYRYLKKLGQLI